MPRDDDEPMSLDDDDRPQKKRRRNYDDRLPKRGMQPWMWGVIAAGVLLPLMCCGGLFALGVFAAKQEEKARTYTPMSADDLIADWKKNPAVAAEKYARTGVTVTGKLHAISSNLSGQTYIEVRGQDGGVLDEIHIFVIERAPLDGLKKCKIGDRVTVKAHATGDAQSRPWLRADDLQPAD